MQTFLPYESFTKSASCLDRQRLGKQRVEAWQILSALQNGGAWSRHPATLMWSGCEFVLCQYGIFMCMEWKQRGYLDTMMPRFMEAKNMYHSIRSPDHAIEPWWLGIEEFHASHRSNLLRKDPLFYGKFEWTESDNLPYWWPTHHTR